MSCKCEWVQVLRTGGGGGYGGHHYIKKKYQNKNVKAKQMYKIQDFFIKIEVGLHGIKQILLMFFILYCIVFIHL